MQDYRNIIESLPEDDKPDFFGLPANIARSSQRMISSQVKLHFSLNSRSFQCPVQAREPNHVFINMNFHKKFRVNGEIFGIC